MTTEQIMQSATELKYASDIDDTCNKLAEAKKHGENVYIVWHLGYGREIRLYSLIDDQESIYQKVLGKSYAEYKAEKLRIEAAREEKRRAAIEAIPARIERGLAIIDKNQDKWEEVVEKHSKGLYLGRDIDHALDLMQAIKDDDFDKAYQMFIESGHSGASFDIVSQIVCEFCSQGESFLDYVYEQQHGLGNS